MPRVIKIEGVPVNAERASLMMASPLRMRLVRYFHNEPGSQSDAAEALAVPNSSLTRNIRALIDAGVLIQDTTSGTRPYVYRVDQQRVGELLLAAGGFLLGDDRT